MTDELDRDRRTGAAAALRPSTRSAPTLGDVVDEADPELARFLALVSPRTGVVDVREPHAGSRAPDPTPRPQVEPAPAIPVPEGDDMADEDDATVAGDPLRGLVADHPALRQLLDAVGVGVMRWDLSTDAVAWSDGAYRVHGRPRWRRVRASGDSLDAVHPEDREVVAGQWRRLRADGLAAVDTDVQRWATLTYRCLRSDGSTGHVSADAMVTTVAGRPVLLAVCADITAEHEAQGALRTQLEYLHAVLATTPDTVLVVDVADDSVVDEAGQGASVAWPLDVHPDDRDTFAAWRERLTLLVDDEVGAVTVRLRDDDTWSWHDVRGVVFHRQGDGVSRVLVVLRDVHEEIEVSRRLAASERRFRVMFDRSPVGQSICDLEDRLVEVNDALCALVGRQRADLLGSALDTLLMPQEAGVEAADAGPRGDDRRLVTADNVERWCRLARTPVEVDGAPRTLVTLADITAERLTAESLRHEALHDPLTGLPNRRLLLDRLATALARARRRGRTVAVFFVDLDDLKRVNDSLGHHAGDLLIVELSRSLSTVLRDTDTLARIGGDEFVAVCEEVDDERAAREVGARIQEAARGTATLEGVAVPWRASVGLAMPESPYDTADDLLRRADAAMYGVKSAAQAQPPTPSGGTSMARTALEHDLREALAADALVLHYQPVVGVAGDVRGVEALLRWPHPQRGLVPAAEIHDLLGAGDLAAPLAVWAADRAVRELDRMGLGGLPVRVNVPARALLRTQVGDEVAASLALVGRDPRSLVLEVHEGDAGSLLARSSTTRALASSGASFGLDRFGADNAALTLLRRLPLTTLALDRHLLVDAAAAPADLAVLRALVDAAGSLGIVTIAVGIETPAAAAAARAAGVSALQGYAVAAPAPLDQLADALLSGRLPVP